MKHPSPRFHFHRSALVVVGILMMATLGCGGTSGKPNDKDSPTPAGNSGSSTAPTSGTIKIVSSLPRTGSARSQTDTIVNGIKMALEEANYRVGDFKIEYEDMDDATATAGEWTPDAEQACAQRAKNDPDVMAYIGPFNSGAAKNSMPILNNVGLLMISPANTAVGLTKPDLAEQGEIEIYRPTGRKNYCRVVPTDDLQGAYAAEWAKDMGVKKVYVLDDNQVYGKGLADIFSERCRELEIEVLGHDSIDTKSQEFKAKMTAIAALKPDLVYFGGTTQTKGGQLCQELVAAGSAAKFMVPDGCRENAFIEAAGPGANERVYVTFGGMPPENQTGAGKVFVDKYVAKHGVMPEAYAVYGYEAANVALEAIRKAGKKDRWAITEAALSLKDFPGALGTWSFDENGDTTARTLSGSIVRDGKFVFERVLGDAGKSE